MPFSIMNIPTNHNLHLIPTFLTLSVCCILLHNQNIDQQGTITHKLLYESIKTLIL